MKQVIPTTYIAKIFHPTPESEDKKMPHTRHSKFTPTPNFKKKVGWLDQPVKKKSDISSGSKEMGSCNPPPPSKEAKLFLRNC